MTTNSVPGLQCARFRLENSTISLVEIAERLSYSGLEVTAQVGDQDASCGILNLKLNGQARWVGSMAKDGEFTLRCEPDDEITQNHLHALDTAAQAFAEPIV
jgi:hypothetical protein